MWNTIDVQWVPKLKITISPHPLLSSAILSVLVVSSFATSSSLSRLLRPCFLVWFTNALDQNKTEELACISCRKQNQHKQLCSSLLLNVCQVSLAMYVICFKICLPHLREIKGHFQWNIRWPELYAVPFSPQNEIANLKCTQRPKEHVVHKRETSSRRRLQAVHANKSGSTWMEKSVLLKNWYGDV